MKNYINNAVIIREPLDLDHPDVFLDAQIPYPILQPKDLIVKVEAISINPADTRARLRKTKDGQNTVLGWDVAGKIVEIGSEVIEDFKIGDEVYYAGDINRSGGNCTYHAIDSRMVAHRPKSIDQGSAAALPLVSLTAWEVLFDRFSFPYCSKGACELLESSNKVKSSILIIGGAGGVGSMAIQLAKLVPGIKIIATASRPETRDWCVSLGADYVIDHNKNIEEQLINIGYPEVAYVLICNSPDKYFSILPQIVSPFGRVCNIVPFSEKQDFNLLMRKSISFYWELMFTYSSFDQDNMINQSKTLNKISKLIDENHIISPVNVKLKEINAKNIKVAHHLIESRSSIGKVVIEA